MASFNGDILEFINIQTCVIPVDLNTDNTNAGDYVSLKNYTGVLIYLDTAAGTAGDDPILNFQQATTVAGGSVKDINVTRGWYKLGTSDGDYTTFTQTAAATIDSVALSIASDTSTFQMAVDIKHKDLDIDNGFDCIRCDAPGTAMGSAQLGSVLYILYGPKVAQTTLLSPIVD